jgi:hypothetical protein
MSISSRFGVISIFLIIVDYFISGKNEILYGEAESLSAERSEANNSAKPYNSYLYIKDAKSYFDEPREKLSSRPPCVVIIK